MNRRIALSSLALSLFAALPRPAAAEIFDGEVAADAQIDREHAEVTITGQAAYALFWVTAYRLRLEDLGTNARRARGQNLTCYAYGPPTDDVAEWTYACHLNVGEFGTITAPPIPDSTPPPPPARLHP